MCSAVEQWKNPVVPFPLPTPPVNIFPPSCPLPPGQSVPLGDPPVCWMVPVPTPRETSATNYPPLGGPLVCRPVPVPTPRETSATSIATTPRCTASIQSQLPSPGASRLPAGSSPDAIPGATPAKKSRCQCKQAAKEAGKPCHCPSLHHFAAASDSGTWCVPPSSSGRIRNTHNSPNQPFFEAEQQLRQTNKPSTWQVRQSAEQIQRLSLHHFTPVSDSGIWCVLPSSSGKIRLYPSHYSLPLSLSSHPLV